VLVTHGGPHGWLLAHLLHLGVPDGPRLFHFRHVGYTYVALDPTARLQVIHAVNQPLVDSP
jgi:hypothetical protein